MKTAGISEIKTFLKKDDPVMVIAGGHEKKRKNKGETGKLVRFVGKARDRVIVEGVNMIVYHQKMRGPGREAKRLVAEGSIHISNVMYYVASLKRPVRLKVKRDDKGKRVRGYLDPKSKKFVAI
jgi:large subunit ribosomal protein L24